MEINEMYEPLAILTGIRVNTMVPAKSGITPILQGLGDCVLEDAADGS